jgi:rSAM/selenodomain-associated transferase 1
MICVFAKDPQQSKTRLAPALGAQGAAQFARAMLEDTLALAPQPWHVWADGAVPAPVHAEQTGPDLGARLLATMEAELATGARAVVIIGTDTPTLRREVIADAHARLESGSCSLALGPTADGGFYLIGATAEAARADLLEDIAWSTERVMRQTLRRALELGLRTHILPWWYDVDDSGDLDLLETHLLRLPRSVAPATRAYLAARRPSSGWPTSRPR